MIDWILKNLFNEKWKEIQTLKKAVLSAAEQVTDLKKENSKLQLQIRLHDFKEQLTE